MVKSDNTIESTSGNSKKAILILYKNLVSKIIIITTNSDQISQNEYDK